MYHLLKCLVSDVEYLSSDLGDPKNDSYSQCPPALEGNPLLLKAQHALVMGHGETKLVLTGQPPPCRPAFMVPEGAVQAASESVTNSLT